jgi:hypothetical protein
MDAVMTPTTSITYISRNQGYRVTCSDCSTWIAWPGELYQARAIGATHLRHHLTGYIVNEEAS